MKKIFILTALAVLLGVASATAQLIAVVFENGETNVYQTLPQAIEGAGDGSVIYLPGGGFPLPDSVKITKKIIIIGIGHKSNNDNVDGTTTIAGNLFFNEGSSGSAVMGCYITGNVNIGDGGTTVNDIMMRYCNLNNVIVNNNTCLGTTINQNYIRGNCQFNNSKANVTNNIMYRFYNLVNGIVKNNIIITGGGDSNNCIINNNIFVKNTIGGNNLVSNNMSKADYGDNFINIGDVDWNDVFMNYNGGAINPMSDFHFKEAYQQYSNIGIYGGSGFNDHQTAPVPYTFAKRIDDQTDAAGNLKIQVRIKNGE